MSIQEDADLLAARIEVVSSQAERAATVDMRAALRAARREVTLMWVARFGDVDALPGSATEAARFAEFALAILRAVLDPGLVRTGRVADASRAAYMAGVREGYRRMAVDADEPDVPDRPVDFARTLTTSGDRLDAALTPDRVSEAGFLAAMDGTRAVELGVDHVEAVVAREVTSAASDGVTDASARAGWHVVWVAERNACLQCLAYAGASGPAGALLTPDASFADVRTASSALTGPAAHPHCRCVLEPLAPGDTGVTDALRREARRSVLRGWSEGESQRAQVRAAERLLAVGSGMPAQVEKTARRAVRDGRFRRGRGN